MMNREEIAIRAGNPAGEDAGKPRGQAFIFL
jgi:hypothetical protein